LVVPRLGFLYRILVTAYQWANRQASCAPPIAPSLERVLGESKVQQEKGRRSAEEKGRVAGDRARQRRQEQPRDRSQDKSQVQVIARAAAILRALEEQPAGLSLGQIAQRVDLARSTVQRIVAALAAEKLLIAASPTGRVRLGPTILRLAASARTDFVALARPFLVRLSNELSETVDLATIKKDHLIFIDQVIGPHRLRAVSAVGETFPLYCTANGKAYLAQLDEVAIARLIGTSFERRTANTITRLDDLLKELKSARKSGVAFDREEHTLGICAAGVVMRDLLGNDVAISVPVPAQRFHAQERLIAERLLATRRSLEEQLAAAAA
jgi:DNA-binding IclR family transcriptional regulator